MFLDVINMCLHAHINQLIDRMTKFQALFCKSIFCKENNVSDINMTEKVTNTQPTSIQRESIFDEFFVENIFKLAWELPLSTI